MPNAETTAKINRFIDDALTSDTDECIIWPFALSPAGYGLVNLRIRMTFVGDHRRMGQAHRYILERLTGGAPSAKHYACHKPVVCHKPACINPRHLRWGTPSANIIDKALDGTDSRGERHHATFLTTEQVLAIRRDGRSQQAIADEYGASQASISRIKLRQTWGWLEDPQAECSKEAAA